ncbi:MAG: hypothetical protein ABJH45_01085 [Paracoccaceae bacterium]
MPKIEPIAELLAETCAGIGRVEFRNVGRPRVMFKPEFSASAAPARPSYWKTIIVN